MGSVNISHLQIFAYQLSWWVSQYSWEEFKYIILKTLNFTFLLAYYISENNSVDNFVKFGLSKFGILWLVKLLKFWDIISSIYSVSFHQQSGPEIL